MHAFLFCFRYVMLHSFYSYLTSLRVSSLRQNVRYFSTFQLLILRGLRRTRYIVPLNRLDIFTHKLSINHVYIFPPWKIREIEKVNTNYDYIYITSVTLTRAYISPFCIYYILRCISRTSYETLLNFTGCLYEAHLFCFTTLIGV